MDYRIVGGNIEVSKKFFSKETLKAKSYFRAMIGLDHKDAKKVQNIVIKGDRVLITYQSSDKVIIGQDFKEFFELVKKEYKDEIKGSILLHMFMDFEFDDFRMTINF